MSRGKEVTDVLDSDLVKICSSSGKQSGVISFSLSEWSSIGGGEDGLY